MRRGTLYCVMFVGLVSMAGSGCTTKATTDEIFDTTSNITASTSGRIWWNEDGLLHPEHKAVAFATYAQANLEQDAAQGHGEYLASLGSLLGIEEQERGSFTDRAQGQFETLTRADRPTQLQYLKGLTK
ncbi:MAG TPA: DUF3015 family protein [Nitrospira sp.]|nr:DUF3015 family protein [Nitrospira sp.]